MISTGISKDHTGLESDKSFPIHAIPGLRIVVMKK